MTQTPITDRNLKLTSTSRFPHHYIEPETARELERIAEAFFLGLDEYAKTADPAIVSAIARYQALKDGK